jgi:hypothetical protein
MRTMKRKASEPGMVRYKKIGGGSFYATLNGERRIIKPGQVFDARPEEIPEGFQDMVMILDEKVAAAEAKKEKGNKAAPPSKLKYFVKKREKGVGYYDVVDGTGKIQNEKALRKDKAEELLDKLLK